MLFFHIRIIPIFFVLFFIVSSSLMFLESSNAQNKDETPIAVKETNEIVMMEPLLFQAVEENNLASVKDILMRGIDPNVRGTNGQTPLMIAVRLENVEIVLALLDAEADPNMKDDSGNTPVTIALTKIYESRKGFNEVEQAVSALKEVSTKDLLKIFTFDIINKDLLMIITALTSYGPCRNALLEKPS